MEFCRVDRAAWPRNEYFEHYFSDTPCTYSMTVKLDVTKIEEKGLKYYPALLYALPTVVNRHEEFRTALDAEGQVGIFSEMLPCYTVFNKETETFSNLWTEYTPDYPAFCARYQEDLRLYGNKGGMMPKPNPRRIPSRCPCCPGPPLRGSTSTCKTATGICCPSSPWAGSLLRTAGG